MNLKISLWFFILATAGIAFGDSLWDPGFKGYLFDGKELKQGDIILVEIDSSSSLSFVSSSSDNKSLTFEFTGGEYGNLLSFLPLIKSSGSGNVKGEEEIVLKSRLATIVTAVDELGNAFLEGSRNISIGAKAESLTLSGILTPGRLGAGNTVSFQHLAGARLTYTTLISPLTATIFAEDIKAIFSGLPETARNRLPLAGVEQPPAEVLPAEGEPVEITIPEAARITGYTLTEERKKELLLLYINNLIDLIFK